MSPGVLAAALAALAVAMGAVFLTVGMRSAASDPEAARERAAALWAQAGGRAADCAALRTEGGVEVHCEGAAGRALYDLRPDGALTLRED